MRQRIDEYEQAEQQKLPFVHRIFRKSMLWLQNIITESIDDALVWLIKKPPYHPTAQERLEAALEYLAAQQRY